MQLRQADVLIASHGRSGSTLLAALLTTPPNRIVLNEPGIAHAAYGTHVRKQLEAAGDIPRDHPVHLFDNPPTSADPAELASTLIAPLVETRDRWGVKEVNPDWIRASIPMLQPKQILVLVRDLDEAAASLYLKNKREGSQKSEAWLIERFRASLEVLADLLQSPTALTRRVWYHQLVSSQPTRDELAAWLDWPLDGNPGRNFDLYNRAHESAAHAGKVSAQSVGRYTPGTGAELDTFVTKLLDATEAERAVTHADRPD
ncbi:MAG: hypothetical protein AAFZ67_10850 [Planctomycetota bacterium]